MINNFRILFMMFSISLFTRIYADVLTSQNGTLFIDLLLKNSSNIVNFFDKKELQESQRLDIKYKNSNQKFLIGYDLDNKVKELKREKFFIKINPENNDYSILSISIPRLNYKYDFYFYQQKLISRAKYYTEIENWKSTNSKYFTFFYQDSDLINEYSVKKLDNFVNKTLKLLHISKKRITQLETSKIKYFLCNENNIKKLSGFETKGIYIIAQDYIISTYNSHYHEICHLLINYRLKNLDLYTLPLLQEGFAVAIGGRGGRNASVITNLGKFLIESDFLKIENLLTRKDFIKNNSSLTYPVSGVFCKYYINRYGIDSFLSLYKKYSTDEAKIENLSLSKSDLRIAQGFESYLNKEINNSLKLLSSDLPVQDSLILKYKENKIFESKERYIFSLNSTISLSQKIKNKNYESKIYKKTINKAKYHNQKYLILFDNNEISVYNLFTDELIANFANGFSLSNKIKIIDNNILFSLPKEIFDDDLKYLALKEE